MLLACRKQGGEGENLLGSFWFSDEVHTITITSDINPSRASQLDSYCGSASDCPFPASHNTEMKHLVSPGLNLPEASQT